MSIFAALCVHIHNKAKGGQSLNTCTIWTNIDNTDNRHTLKRLQARARYGQRGQPNTDTPPRADVSTPETAVFKAKSPFYAAGGQSLNTTRPNMDNVDNRTQTRPPLCVRIRPVGCVVSTTGQKPETDERHAFSFGRVLAVFVKCRNTNIYPLFRLYFGYI